jgi:hypothetical protein
MRPSEKRRELLMLTTIAVILVAMVAAATLEIWLFWRLGEREDRRRGQGGLAARRPWTGASTDIARRSSSGRDKARGARGATHAYG